MNNQLNMALVSSLLCPKQKHCTRQGSVNLQLIHHKIILNIGSDKPSNCKLFPKLEFPNQFFKVTQLLNVWHAYESAQATKP